MTFIHATAAFGSRASEVLSADNALPERHIIIETLRKAAPLLGLKPTVIATLDAMLSCLAPKRNHNMVFASNMTLSARRNGLSERTLRRHAATLMEAGLLERKDSANGKRFTRYDPAHKQSMHFGFDLSPLFYKLGEIAAMAVAAQEQSEQIAYLKSKIRAQLRPLLHADPNDSQALETLRKLRNKLTADELAAISKTLPEAVHESASDGAKACVSAPAMSANDGQNVRHHQRSKKENTEEESVPDVSPQAGETLTLGELVTACPEAASFSLRNIEHFGDVVAHAQTLAPMIGIDQTTYTLAVRTIGVLPSAITVWAIVQCHDRIRNAGAYFRALTSGAKSRDFDAVRFIKRLASASPGQMAPT